MKKISKLMAGVVAAGALAIPAIAVVPALASESPTTTSAAAPTTVPAPNSSSTTPSSPSVAKGRGQRRGQKLLRRAAVNKVSAQLGITPDALRAAVKDARANHKPAQPITDKAARRQYWLAQVAGELHVTPQQLQAAVKAARQEIRSELLGK
jgi:hypothetical protein